MAKIVWRNSAISKGPTGLACNAQSRIEARARTGSRQALTTAIGEEGAPKGVADLAKPVLQLMSGALP